jgi:predicted transcriptional regulator of viral defense system
MTPMDDDMVAPMMQICYIDAMRYETALEIIGNDALFETELLFAGAPDPQAIQRQLPRWVRSGRLTKLRRGLYAVPAPHRTAPVDPFEVSNRLVRPSFVSMESALHYHELIPDVPFGVTAATTGRGGTHRTPLGTYVYHHVGSSRFWGFDEREVAPGRRVYVATPERALLDLLYIRRGSDTAAYLGQLRLQNLDRLDDGALDEAARRFGVARVGRALGAIHAMARDDSLGWVTL